MSATQPLDMRHEEFPIDLFSLQLDDFDMVQDDGRDLLPLQIQVEPSIDVCLQLQQQERQIYQQLQQSPTLSSPTQLQQQEPTQQTTFQHGNRQPRSQPSSNPQSYGPTPIHTPNITPAITPSVSPSSSYPNSPGSSTAYGTYGKQETKQKVPRHKRKSHIDAEHRRRNKIQGAFDELKEVIPAIADSSKSAKESKSNMLNKTVDYCRQLRAESKELQREAARLREELQALTSDINEVQDQLPAAGVTSPVSNNPQQMDKMFENYVHTRTLANWKFWIFGLLIRPLFQSYNDMVLTESRESFLSSVMSWLDQHCSLRALRPAMSNTLRQISTSTSILTAPEQLPEEAIDAALKTVTTEHDHTLS